MKLLSDCSCYSIIKKKPEYCEMLNTSTYLIYRLHVARINNSFVSFGGLHQYVKMGLYIVYMEFI